MRCLGENSSGRLPRDAKCIGAIAMLVTQGADEMRHSGRTLLDHLIGTAQLLIDGGAQIDTVRAGLCHSAYGTNAYRHACVNDRRIVQRVIGRRAERLVFLFSRLRRPSTLLRAEKNRTMLVRCRGGRTMGLRAEVLRELLVLERANLKEQRQ